MFLDQIKPVSQPVDEAYIGKQTNLLAMEKCIERIRKKYYHAYDILDLVLLKNVETDPDWHRLIELIEDQFGFYSVTLTLFEIEPSTYGATPNACTYPLHYDPVYMAKLRPNLKVDSNHIRYDKKAKVCTMIVVNPKLMFAKEVTPGEVLAIMLHEIGHNFEDSTLVAMLPLHYIRLIAVWSQMLAKGNTFSIALMATVLLNPVRRLYNDQYKKMQKDPTLFQLYSFMVYCLQYIIIAGGMTVKNAIWFCIIQPLQDILPKNTVDFLKMVIDSIPTLNPLALINAQITYVSEKYSDSFVALHGYGPEFISGVKKMHNMGDVFGVNELLQTTPILGHILGLNNWIFGHIMSVLEGHPDDATRMLTQVNVLEADLKNTQMDPKARKLVEKDIADCKNALRETKLNYNTMNRNSKAKTAYNIQTQVFLDNIVTKLFPNGDLRTEIMNIIGMGRDSIVKNINAKKEKPDSWF